MQGKRLLFIIPVVLFVSAILFLFVEFVPTENAYADTPSLNLGGSFDREYGAFILNSGIWSYDKSADVFVSYGNVDAGSFVPYGTDARNKSDELYEYKCVLNLYVSDANGDIEDSNGGKYSRPYDENGLCILKPNASYKISDTRTTKGAFAILYPIDADGSVVEDETKALYLDYYKDRNELYIRVNRRKLTVDVDFEGSTGISSYSIGEKNSDGFTALSLSRVYSIPTLLEFIDAESENDGLVFDHRFESFGISSSDNNGLFVYDDVKTYDPFAFDSTNVKIVDGNGKDVTDYYEIVSKYVATVTVDKLKIVAPTYDFESIYLQNCIDIGDVVFDGENAIILSSGYDLRNVKSGSNHPLFMGSEQRLHYTLADSIEINSNLIVEYSYRIHTTKSCFYPTVTDGINSYSLYVNASEYNVNPTYDCQPVLVRVSLADETIDSNNFEITPIDGYTTTLQIKKRSIVLYAKGTEYDYPGEFNPTQGESFIAVSVESFSNPYGLAYNEKSTTSVFIDTTGDGVADTEITVTFRIKRFSDFLNDSSFYKSGDKVLLNTGEYAIEPDAINDWRYNATIHRSLHYTVTPKQISMADLFAEGSFVNAVESINDAYIIEDFDFDSAYDLYKTVELKFRRRLPDNDADGEYISEDPIFGIFFSFAENPLPGIYKSIGIYDNDGAIVYNYELTDIPSTEGIIDNVAIRINKKQLFVTVPEKEYDGNRVETTISGETEGSPYNCVISYCKGTTFVESKKLKSAPVDAGNYVVRVSLEQGSIYSFAGDKDFIDVAFIIQKRKVTVTVTSKGEKTFGVEGYFRSPSDSNIATYTVRYAADETQPALIGKDSLGALSSDGAKASAKPSVYDIDVSGIGNANYDVTIEYASGKRKETLTVTKLKTVNKLLESFGKSDANPNPTGQTVSLNNFMLLGNVVPVTITYQIDGQFVASNVQKNANGYVITGLSEGTNYVVRYTLPKNNDYADLGRDYVICEFTVSTILTAPEWDQNFEKTEKDNIFIIVTNYEADKYFVYIENDYLFESGFTFDIPSSCIEKIYDPDDEELLLYVIFDLGKALSEAENNTDGLKFDADSSYSLWVMRKTDDISLDTTKVEPKIVYTKADKPSIKKSEIEVKSSSISIALPTTDDENVTFVIKYIKGETGKQTISSLVDDDIDLTERFFGEKFEVLTAKGSVLTDLVPNTIYYIMIYAVRTIDSVMTADGEIIETIEGTPIYFEIHTPKSNWENVKAVVFLEKISGYFGISTIGVLTIVLIILCVRFASIKRKWRIQ